MQPRIEAARDRRAPLLRFANWWEPGLDLAINGIATVAVDAISWDQETETLAIAGTDVGLGPLQEIERLDHRIVLDDLYNAPVGLSWRKAA